MGVNTVTQTKGTSRGGMVPQQGGPSLLVEDMPRGHGTLFSTIDEATIVELPHEQGMLSSATSKVSTKGGETLCKVGALSGIARKVSMKKGEVISSLASKATGDGEGS